ncbi:RNA-splicing factor [Batrachochytrium dendrobatidis]|nr:RNA-splicing factor [Batrachochytrium dendrobatidis]
MYNGIGLSTARGSGTNGYVQRNMSALRPRNEFKKDISSFNHSNSLAHRKPNQGILEHDRKRQIELKCLELQESLEEQGTLGEDEILAQVSTLRKSMLADLNNVQLDATNIKSHQVHRIAEAKEKANKRFESAFGIDTSDFVEGGSFDQERLDQKRNERAIERQRKETEYFEKQARREQEQKDALKQRARQDAAAESLSRDDRRGRNLGRDRDLSNRRGGDQDRRRRSRSLSSSDTGSYRKNNSHQKKVRRKSRSPSISPAVDTRDVHRSALKKTVEKNSAQLHHSRDKQALESIRDNSANKRRERSSSRSRSRSRSPPNRSSRFSRKSSSVSSGEYRSKRSDSKVSSRSSSGSSQSPNRRGRSRSISSLGSSTSQSRSSSR